MLVVFQFAFADLRDFSVLREARTSKPNWNLTNLQGFVRGFGQVESRYQRLKNPNLRNLYKREKVEKHYINCTRRVFPVFDNKLLPEPWEKCLHIYTRLISDGKLSFRLEIGLHVVAQTSPSSNELKKLLKFISNSQLLLKDRADPNKKSYKQSNAGMLVNVASRMRNRIQQKTTLHAGQNIEDKLNTDFLDSLGILVFADLSDFPLNESISDESLVSAPNNKEFEIAFLESHISGHDLGVWALGRSNGNALSIDDVTADKIRRVRLHILRFSAELRALEVAVSAAQNGTLKFGETLNSYQALEEIVEGYLERLVHTSDESMNDIGELKVGKLVNAEALFDVVEKIKSNLDRLKILHTGPILDQLKKVQINAGTIVFFNNIQREPSFNIENIGGDKVSGDQIKGNKGGIIAKNIKAENINVHTSWSEFDPNGDFDEEKLRLELRVLKEVMSNEASSEEQLDELSAIQKASLAAEQKEKSKILEHLGGAGKWALTVAEKIGVPVAKEVLKKLVGI